MRTIFFLTTLFHLSNLLWAQSVNSNFKPVLTGSASVSSLAIEETGDLLVAGDFTSVQYNYDITEVVRIDKNGNLDPNFKPKLNDSSTTTAILPLSNGQILLARRSLVWIFGVGFDSVWVSRLNYDGSIDTTFNHEVDNTFMTISSMKIHIDGKILIAGTAVQQISGIATYTEKIKRLNRDGTSDTSFNVDSPNKKTSSGFLPNDLIKIQDDGKILFRGQFTEVNGITADAMVRLNSDGTIDSTFQLHQFSGFVSGMGIDTNGKILITGNFTDVDGSNISKIVRLNTTGSIDTTYVTDYTGEGISDIKQLPDGKFMIFPLGYSGVSTIYMLSNDGLIINSFANNYITDGGGYSPGSGGYAKVVDIGYQLLDDKLILGGSFQEYNGTLRIGVLRLNSDSSLDTTYNLYLAGEPKIDIIEHLSNNEILVAGKIFNANSKDSRSLIKLMPNGELNSQFNIGSGARFRARPYFYSRPFTSLSTMPNSQFYLAGYFNEFNDVNSFNLAKVGADGVADSLFAAGGNKILTTFVQQDNKLIIGGEFIRAYGEVPTYLKRFNADGSIDSTFTSSTEITRVVQKIIELPGGKLLVGSSNINEDISEIQRLNPNGVVDTLFNNILLNANRDIIDIIVFDNSKIVILANGTHSNRLGRMKDLFIYDFDGKNQFQIFDNENLLAIEKVSATEFVVSGVNMFLKMDTNGVVNENFKLDYKGRIEAISFNNDSLTIGGSLTEVDREPIFGLAKISNTNTTPLSPSNLTAINITSDSVSIQWSDNSTLETGFEIFRSINGSAFESLIILNPETVNYTDKNVQQEDTIIYKVRAINDVKISKFSNSVEVIIPLILGIINDKVSERWIYPNPGKSIFRWHLSDYAEDIMVYNNLGVHIMTEELNIKNDYSFDLSDFPNGIYFVKSISRPTLTVRVIKN